MSEEFRIFTDTEGLDPNPPKAKKSEKPQQQDVSPGPDSVDVDSLPGRIRNDHGTGTYQKAKAFEKGLSVDEKK